MRIELTNKQYETIAYWCDTYLCVEEEDCNNCQTCQDMRSAVKQLHKYARKVTE